MWKNININKQNIQYDSDKAVLINCPHKSNYDSYSFWYPSKLVRDGKHSYAVSLGYTNDFKFKLVKYGKGKWNSRDIIAEKEISAEEFEEMFGVMDENIVVPKQDNESYVKVEEPEKVEKEIELVEGLKND